MQVVEFSQSFFWTYRDTILPATTLWIPLAIEGIGVIGAILQDPGCIGRKLSSMKQSVYDATHQRQEEKLSDYRKRLAINIAITAVAVAAIGLSVAAPFILMPGTFAIPAALAAIQTSTLALKYIFKLPGLAQRAKDYLVDSFNQRQGESLELFHARRCSAVMRMALCAALFAGAAAAACFLPYLANCFAGASVWNLYDVLPFQTPAVVFAEYLFLGGLHAIESIRAWKQGNKQASLFHLACALSSILFPAHDCIYGSQPMRLHHSFIGLALQLAPWRSVKFFGSVVSFDSMLYIFSPRRGYVNEWGSFNQYDYMNTVVDRLPFVLNSLTFLTILENALDWIFETRSLAATPPDQASSLLYG